MKLQVIHDIRAPARLPLLKRELEIQGVGDYRLAPGADDENPSVAVRLAHQGCFEWAITQGHDRVWIAEDDVVFTAPGAWDHFVELVKKIGGFVTGGTYGGHYTVKEKHDGWARVEQLCGLHLYSCPTSLVEVVRKAEQWHLDIWFARNVPEVKMAWPIVAYQRPGYSVKDKKFMDHDKLLEGLERWS